MRWNGIGCTDWMALEDWLDLDGRDYGVMVGLEGL